MKRKNNSCRHYQSKVFSHESTAKLRLNDSLWGSAGLQKKKSDGKSKGDGKHPDNYPRQQTPRQLPMLAQSPFTRQLTW